MVFVQMILKKLPDVIDSNPAKVVAAVVKIIVQIKEVCRLTHG